jgi:hypothetical protein
MPLCAAQALTELWRWSGSRQRHHYAQFVVLGRLAAWPNRPVSIVCAHELVARWLELAGVLRVEIALTAELLCEAPPV